MSLSARQKAYLSCYDVCYLPLSGFATLSSCSAVLAVATCYGTIHLIAYRLPGEDENKEISIIQTRCRLPANRNLKVLSLTIIGDSFLVAATEGILYAWRFSDLEKLLLESEEKPQTEISSLAPAWTLCVPSHTSGDTEEVNSILFRADSSHLYAANGGGHIYCFDVDSGGSLVTSWKAHEDSVLRICSLQDNSLHIASASEDGYVRVWDERSLTSLKNKNLTTSSPAQEFVPSADAQTSRPALGKWVSALSGGSSENSDWLICGGGPFLSLWSRRALKPATLFHPNSTIATANQGSIYEKSIATPSIDKWYAQTVVCNHNVSAIGFGPMLYQWDFSGRELCAEKTRLKHGMAAIFYEANDETILACVGAGKHVEIISDIPLITRACTSLEIL